MYARKSRSVEVMKRDVEGSSSQKTLSVKAENYFEIESNESSEMKVTLKSRANHKLISGPKKRVKIFDPEP